MALVLTSNLQKDCLPQDILEFKSPNNMDFSVCYEVQHNPSTIMFLALCADPTNWGSYQLIGCPNPSTTMTRALHRGTKWQVFVRMENKDSTKKWCLKVTFFWSQNWLLKLCHKRGSISQSIGKSFLALSWLYLAIKDKSFFDPEITYGQQVR